MLVLFDFAAGEVCQGIYFRQTSGARFELTNTIELSDAEILILGSSRAVHHYDTRVLESELELTVQNGGRDGQGLLFQNSVLTAILRRHQPKLIILDLLHNNLDDDKVDPDRLAALFPYIDRIPGISESLLEFDPSTSVRLAKASKIYRYNSLLVPALCHVLRPRKEENQGFKPLQGVLPADSIAVEAPVTSSPNRLLSMALEDLCRKARQADVQLVGVMSPVFRVPDRRHCGEMRRILNEYDFEIWDFMTEPEFQSPELFSDPGHLNEKGAERFSIRLSEVLRSKSSILNVSDEK